jgi:hypothetical protein
MPIRPDLPAGLNLSRRVSAPVRLPKLTFPMAGGMLEPAHATPEDGVEGTVPMAEPATAPAAAFGPPAPAAMPTAEPAAPAPAADPAPPARTQSDLGRVVVYGRAGSKACIEAVQDLIARRVCFVYYDVDRDSQAMQNLNAICGGAVVVPVVVQIGGNAT